MRTWAIPLVGLLGLCIASLLLGARTGVDLNDIVRWISAKEPRDAHTIILAEMRFPRTVAALLAGAALGASGALIQSLSRNPLADPGLLGVNAGAAFGIVAAVWYFGPLAPSALIVPAVLGAAVAVLVVSAIGTLSSNPVTFVLAGAALTALLTAALRGLILLDPFALDVFRQWIVGAVDQSSKAVLEVPAWLALLGAVLAVVVARWLDVLSLGADLAASLGLDVRRVRAIGLSAIAILSAVAVMVAGPIAFLGLLAPHMARRLGSESVLAVTVRAALIGASLLLLADIIGRIILPGVVIEAGLSVTLIGAPFLIWLVRRNEGARL
jgi:iron complex transport system permease protein